MAPNDEERRARPGARVRHHCTSNSHFKAFEFYCDYHESCWKVAEGFFLNIMEEGLEVLREWLIQLPLMI